MTIISAEAAPANSSDWVEFLPQDSSLSESRLLNGNGPFVEAVRAPQPYAAVQIPLSWTGQLCAVAESLKDQSSWHLQYPHRDLLNETVSQHFLLCGLHKPSFGDNTPLVEQAVGFADVFLPNVYKKSELLKRLGRVVSDFVALSQTKSVCVSLEAGPSRQIFFQQPQNKGVQAVVSLTPEGLLIANPQNITPSDAASIAVGCLSQARAQEIAGSSEKLRGGVLVAFNDLTKPAPVAYIAPALSEGVSVRFSLQGILESGPAYDRKPGFLRRTMDYIKTGPC